MNRTSPRSRLARTSAAVLSLALLAACGGDDAATDRGSITLTPSTGGDGITFSPVLVTGHDGPPSFLATWYSQDPATATSGRYLVMDLTETDGVVDGVSFFDRPDFADPIPQAMFTASCSSGVPCLAAHVTLDMARREAVFTELTLPLYLDSSGLPQPPAYVINGVLRF